MRWQIWQRVTGSWVTVTGKRREGDLLICLYDARSAGVILHGAHAARTPRGRSGPSPRERRCMNIRIGHSHVGRFPEGRQRGARLITVRVPADRARRTVLGHGTLQDSSAHPRLRLRPHSGRGRATASWRGKERTVPSGPNVSQEGHRSRAIRRAAPPCQGLNSFQCPSETISTVPSITLTTVSSSIAYVGTGSRPAHFSAFATSW